MDKELIQKNSGEGIQGIPKIERQGNITKWNKLSFLDDRRHCQRIIHEAANLGVREGKALAGYRVIPIRRSEKHQSVSILIGGVGAVAYGRGSGREAGLDSARMNGYVTAR